MKNPYFIFLCIIAMLPLNVVANNLTDEDQCGKTLNVKSVYEFTDGIYNYKNFSIDASETDSYYAEFWLRPAEYPTSEFTTFSVYVNSVYVGEITPSCGNWQAIRLNGNKLINLSAGSNEISIATLAPEFPDVETVKVSNTSDGAVISSDEYDTYLEEASKGDNKIHAKNNKSKCLPAVSENNSVSFDDIPLKYTFYKMFSFAEDEEIYITTSSATEHVVDVILRGTLPSVSAPMTTVPSILNSSIGRNHKLIFDDSSSEEMQGLNWKGISEKNNLEVQQMTMKVIIPKTGIYLVRVRPKNNGVIGVVDVNVNGRFLYEDAPIYCYKVDYTIPADGNEYVTMTKCANSTGDSMIFIHGIDYSDRIVGFNDDATFPDSSQFSLSAYDSCIRQKYIIKTCGISINNYSSSNPETTCVIKTFCADSDIGAKSNKMNYNALVRQNIYDTLQDDTQIECDHTNEQLLILSSRIINQVAIYDTMGKLVFIENPNMSEINIPFVLARTNSSSVYTVVVVTNGGVFSKKILIK